MRAIILVLSSCFVFSKALAAPDLWIEAQIVHQDGFGNASQINGGAQGSVNDTFGYYVFGQTSSQGYRQIYAGPTIKPVPWLQIGAGLGKENVGDHHRHDAFFWAGNEKISVFGTFEDGASGPWHKVMLNYRMTSSFGIGFMDQKYLGRGIQLEYAPLRNIVVWGAILRDVNRDATNSTIAVTYRF